MERERPLSMNLWLGQYYREHCPECGARACVTQHKLYDEYKVPRCTEAGDDFHCRRVGCCHGCLCDRDHACPPRCACDCHHCEVVVVGSLPRPSATACTCYACVNRLDCPVKTLPTGQRVTRRPRDCQRFASLGPGVFSTHYNNEDGRNRRLDSYFVKQPQRPRQHQTVEMIVIDDDEEEINQ
jgi:hypothetical protein